MRHALIPIQLLHEARNATRPSQPERQVADAPAEVPPATQPKSQPLTHRLAVLVRRARALVVRTT
jgi:hypothetical protein